MSVSEVCKRTDFCVADKIVWKKRSALPNNVSPNKLTRICEDVFVFVRKEDYLDYHCNKEVVSKSKSGQNIYENIFNLIEADNNDGANNLNKATYSTQLCRQLLTLYAPKEGVVYDPFMGTGTTAVAAKRYGCSYIGSEISAAQTEYANARLLNEQTQFSLF